MSYTCLSPESDVIVSIIFKFSRYDFRVRGFQVLIQKIPRARQQPLNMPATRGGFCDAGAINVANFMTKVRNDLFDAGQGLDRGKPFLIEAVWYLAKCCLFLTPLPVPSRLKCSILRLFGARIGKGVVIKPQVKIHFPWKLTVGDFAWIGEEVFILNFEPISIGAHCCISQRTFLCGGSHDYRKPEMPYRNKPIRIEDGVWLGAQVFVSPGVTVGSEAVIATGSVVTANQPPGMVCGGNPCLPIKDRWLSRKDSVNSKPYSSSNVEPAAGPQASDKAMPRCAPVTMDLPAYSQMGHTELTAYITAGDVDLPSCASSGVLSANKH